MVVEPGELEEHLHCLGLVCPGEAGVDGPLEDAGGTMEEEVRADWVGPLVGLLVPRRLLRHEEHGGAAADGLGDLGPHVGRVVAVQVSEGGVPTNAGEVLGVRERPDDVDHVVERGLRVLGKVALRLAQQQLVVRDQRERPIGGQLAGQGGLAESWEPHRDEEGLGG